MEAQKEELAEVEQNISQNLTLEDGIELFVRRSLLQDFSDSLVDPNVQTPSISSFSSTEADTTVIVKYKKYLHWTNTGGTGKSEFYSDSFTDSSSTLGTFCNYHQGSQTRTFIISKSTKYCQRDCHVGIYLKCALISIKMLIFHIVYYFNYQFCTIDNVRRVYDWKVQCFILYSECIRA